ncbi:sulfotransferase [Aestuariibacter halophilus]|uniref:Sulfotransferase n=1 Tax=Fluctibacter halophilus TaxID=226011 RepID=A0ABS8G341_9ALTE|nr:sulfotransferase [Aestuariibacter halophilus]MCC2614868.1 sulfotransferase [Aestuariibacter halophilus]
MSAHLQGFPPNVFLLGAQKAGTTQLASYLDQHPDICLSAPKEPDFFTQHFDKGLSWFEQRFEDTRKCLIDASTSYSCAPLPDYFSADVGRVSAYAGIAQRIADTVPDARFIYIMRNPTDRAYSAYLHQVRAGLESRPFEQAIEQDSYYLRTGLYQGQLELYLAHFAKDRFHFAFFEEFIKTPHDHVKACFAFLGLDQDVALHENVSQNQSFVYSGPFGRLNQAIGRRGGLNQLVKTIKPLIPRSLLEKTAKVMTEKPPKMTEKQRQIVDAFYAPYHASLAELVGRTSLPW